MADPRWTPETEELAARRIAAVDKHRCDDVDEVWRSYREQASAVMSHLADAGLVLPPGGKTHEEWAVRVDEPHPRRGEKAGDHLALPGGELIARHGPRIWAGWVPVRRTVHIGPWIEVPQ